MSHAKQVGTSEVREFLFSDAGQAALTEAGLTVGKRGRLTPAQVAVYHKANRGRKYNPEADAPTITVPVKGLNKAGRAMTKNVTITTAEARTLLGQPTSRRGRFNRVLLSQAIAKRDGISQPVEADES